LLRSEPFHRKATVSASEEAASCWLLAPSVTSAKAQVEGFDYSVANFLGTRRTVKSTSATYYPGARPPTFANEGLVVVVWDGPEDQRSRFLASPKMYSQIKVGIAMARSEWHVVGAEADRKKLQVSCSY